MLALGLGLLARAVVAQIAVTNVAMHAGVVDLAWTPSTAPCIVASSSSLSTDTFHFVGQVVSTNWTAVTNASAASFYRIRQVGVVAIADPNLQSIIRAAIPNPHTPAGPIYDIDVEGLTNLSAWSASIADATGIGNLANLTMVDLGGNALMSLDVSMLPALRMLACNANHDDGLGTLVLTGCTNLLVLHCDNNVLTGLDLSSCRRLQDVSCSVNALTDLDVSGFPALEALDCSFNVLAALVPSACPALRDLRCDFNQLTNLDVSACPELRDLHCDFNQLTSLDVSACTNLQVVECSDNPPLGQLTLGNSAYTNVSCARGQLTSLDLQNCHDLVTLDCEGNAIDALDLSDCGVLQTLSCANNGLTSLDVSQCANLESLSCSSNELISLDVCPYSNLTHLEANDNHITDVTPLNTLTRLNYVSLRGNPIYDLTPLIPLALSGWLNGCQVYLSGDRNSISGIDTLENNGVTVTCFPDPP